MAGQHVRGSGTGREYGTSQGRPLLAHAPVEGNGLREGGEDDSKSLLSVGLMFGKNFSFRWGNCGGGEGCQGGVRVWLPRPSSLSRHGAALATLMTQGSRTFHQPHVSSAKISKVDAFASRRPCLRRGGALRVSMAFQAAISRAGARWLRLAGAAGCALSVSACTAPCLAQEWSDADMRYSLAQYFDHTALKVRRAARMPMMWCTKLHTPLPQMTTTEADILKLCQEAAEHNFKTVCVNGGWVATARAALDAAGATHVGVCAVVGFPLGAGSSLAKAFETQAAIADGAVEIDMVLPVGHFRSGAAGRKAAVGAALQAQSLPLGNTARAAPPHSCKTCKWCAESPATLVWP